jgi:hypothetical protein
MPSNRTCPVVLALVNVGDRDRAPDGVLHTLTHEERIDLDVGDGSLDAVDPVQPPTIEEVVRFEDLPPGSLESRRAWSAGATAPRARRFPGTQMISYPQSTTSGGSEGG